MVPWDLLKIAAQQSAEDAGGELLRQVDAIRLVSQWRGEYADLQRVGR